MKKAVVLAGLLAAGAQAQTTNNWVGATNIAAIGSWTNEANWSLNPDIPDADTEVASFTADFTVNPSVTLDGAKTINGLIYRDTVGSQYLTVLEGSPTGALTFAGAAPFVSVLSGGESQPLILSPVVDFSSFTKIGSGWLRLLNLASGDLPTSLTVSGGALLLQQAGSNIVATPAGFAKTGGGQFVLQNNMTLIGSGDIVVNQGRMEVRKGSTNFTGNIVVNGGAEYVGRQTYADQFGDAVGTTTVNGNSARAKFQDPPGGFICAETWNLNGFRADGSLQMDYADGYLTGPVNITTNTHIDINTFANAIRHTRLQGVISDGVSSGGVTFTIGYGGGATGGADTQYTNLFTASRFILSASNTYKGATWMSVRSGSTNVANQVLVVELTNGNDRLPATTVLTLGGTPPGVVANGGASAVVLLDGVSQRLGGLATAGTGIHNRVSSTTPDLCVLTLNTTAGASYTFNGVIGGTNSMESNIELVKLGTGTQVLNGANTYTGQTTVRAGVLQIGHGAALGATSASTSVSNGAQLRVAGNIVVNEELIVSGSGSGGNLGVIRSVSDTNTLNGPVTFVDALQGRIQTASGSLFINGGVTSSNQSVMFASGNGTTTTIASNAVNVGTAAVFAHDPGTFRLNVSGNLMGRFNPAWQDYVYIGAPGALPTNVILDIGQSSIYPNSSSGTLDLNGYDVMCSSLFSSYNAATTTPYKLVVKNSSAAASVLTVSQDTNTVYEGVLEGNLSLVKDGTGTLQLTGTNTYQGGTFISAGTLLVNGANLATGDVVVGLGGTLAGTGTLAGAVTSSGLVAPAASAGVLTLLSGYTQAGSGWLGIEIGGTNPGSDYDQLVVGGVANLGGTLSVTLTNAYAPSAGDAFVLVIASNGLAGSTFVVENLPALTPPELGWSVQYLANAVMLSVTSGSGGPVGFDLYAQQIPNAADRGYQNDPDGDGYANLLEYVTGGNPTNADVVAQMKSARTNGVLALKFSRSITATDATLYVEGSYATTNDATWTGIATNLAGSWGGAPNVSEAGGPDPVNVTVEDADPAATNRFLRLRVTRP